MNVLMKEESHGDSACYDPCMSPGDTENSPEARCGVGSRLS